MNKQNTKHVDRREEEAERLKMLGKIAPASHLGWKKDYHAGVQTAVNADLSLSINALLNVSLAEAGYSKLGLDLNRHETKIVDTAIEIGKKALSVFGNDLFVMR